MFLFLLILLTVCLSCVGLMCFCIVTCRRDQYIDDMEDGLIE